MRLQIFITLSLAFFSSLTFAGSGLVIHTTELGVAKFHRADNRVHSYGPQHGWTPYILPDSAPTDAVLSQKNQDGSYTVFFSTLDEMMNSVVQISKNENQKVSVLNIHGHGLPGAMWFPKDAATLNSVECTSWREAASGSDDANYSQYYTPISAADIRQIRQISNSLNFHMGCTTGLREWQNATAKNSEFKMALSNDAELHFASCVVGLGLAGDKFTLGIASLLLGPSGRVETSTNFGLGDWSMPQGMGFWDYQTDQQLQQDNQNYVNNRQDSQIAQKGVVRIAAQDGKQWKTSLWADQNFMNLNGPSVLTGTQIYEVQTQIFSDRTPASVRIPGTSVYTTVEVAQ